MPAHPYRVIGGHAIVFVGYDDQLLDESTSHVKGYFKFRNSWGESWGKSGYGYLPYAYIQYCFDSWKVTGST